MQISIGYARFIPQHEEYARFLNSAKDARSYAPHHHLRLLAWSASLSILLWCSLIFAALELWKAWR